jgi:hypothetical protein
MKLMKRTLVGLLCLTFATIAAAAGTQRIVSHAGTCEMTVPGNWKVDSLIKSSASSPDESMSAVVSTARGMHATSEVKPIIESTFKPVQTFEDSPQRLWFAYEAGSGEAGAWYVGVPGKAGVCGAQIGFKHAAQAALAKQIALSVKAAG